jgi:hypothetical protein
MKVHVLERSADNNVRLVVHFPVPVGVNTANYTWKVVLLASGRSGVTILQEGTAGYQITTAEKAEVTLGDTCEIVVYFDAGRPVSELDEHVTEAIRQWTANVKDELKQYGKTRS